MTLQHISEFNDLIEHLVDLLVILIEFLHQLHLILIHVSVCLLIINFLIFLSHLKHLLPRFEYHLILDVGIGEYLDAEFALFEGVLVVEEVAEDIQVVLDALQPVNLVRQLLLRVLLLLLFLSELRLHGLQGLKAVMELALYPITKCCKV